MKVLGVFLAVLGTAVAFSVPALAQDAPPPADQSAPTTPECLDNHEQSQVARSDGRLLDARKNLLRCSNVACPSLIQSDCARWFDEVGEMVPTVVVTVRRGSADVMKAEVELDGKVVAQNVTGQEFSVDPGPHEIKIRVAGEKEQSRQVMLARGEKHRLVSFELPVPEAERSEMTSSQAPSVPAEPAVPMERPVPMITYVLAGTAGALAIGGGVFGMMALNEQDNLSASPADGGCKPSCTDDQLSTLHTDAWISNGLFIGSAAAAIGALATYVWRPEVPVGQDTARRAAPALRVGAAPHGAFMSYGGTF